MSKNTKPVRRPAGIPLTISLKPRPTAGNDLASDIFRAVKNDTETIPAVETKEAAAAPIEPPQSSETETATVPIEKTAVRPSTRTDRQRRSSVKIVGSINTLARRDPVERLFEKSKAKELYDVLLSLTHRSESPTDKVRVPRSYLMANTSIKTRITLDQNLKRLEELGLIKRTSIIGEQEGNLYQVNLPENDGM